MVEPSLASPTSPSLRADRIKLTTRLLLVWGSRSGGSALLPMCRVWERMPASTADSRGAQPTTKQIRRARLAVSLINKLRGVEAIALGGEGGRQAEQRD